MINEFCSSVGLLLGIEGFAVEVTLASLRNTEAFSHGVLLQAIGVAGDWLAVVGVDHLGAVVLRRKLRPQGC
jgi:hypothetical protein